MNPFDDPQSPLPPLVLHEILDRGIPNMERVAIRATQNVDTRYHGIIAGVKLASGTAIPLNDNFLWLGTINLRPDDWIFVYTRRGEFNIAPIAERPANNLYSVFWGRPTTIFHNPDIIPILMRMVDIQLGQIPKEFKQLNP